MNCKNCGGTSTSWFPTNRVNSVAVDGRLKSNEISCDFVLGCDDCSETLRVVSADDIARQMNAKPTTIKGENFVDFLNTDRPYICRKTEGTCYLLIDRETGEFVGYRKYDDDMPTFKPLEWERGKIFLTAKSVDGAVFTIREINGSWRLATWSVIGAVKNLGLHPSPEEAKAAAQALHNEAVAKYLEGQPG
jgi:hypothetical protein